MGVQGRPLPNLRKTLQGLLGEEVKVSRAESDDFRGLVVVTVAYVDRPKKKIHRTFKPDTPPVAVREELLRGLEESYGVVPLQSGVL